MAKKMFQEYPKSLPVELFPLLGHQSTILQTDGTKDPDFFVCWNMPEDRIFDFGRNPHNVPRSVLLEMAFIEAPKIKVVSSQKPANFFYMPPAPPGWLLRSAPGAYVGETQSDGKDVDTVVPLPLNQTLALNGATTGFHPTALAYIPSRWEASVNRPLTVSTDGDATRKAVLSPRHRSALPILPLENDGTNTGWCEGNALIRFPLHTCSSLGKARAIHEVGDHIGIPRILKFPAAASTLPTRDHQISTFPWLPPFWVTMLAQNLSMRN